MYANNMNVAARLRWKDVNSFNFYHCLTFPSSFTFLDFYTWLKVKKGDKTFFLGYCYDHLVLR